MIRNLKIVALTYGSVFFTVGTLFGFGSVFGLDDAFLQFLLKDFAHEFLTGKEQEVIEVVEGLSVLGGVNDVLAFGEQGIEAFDENVANAGWECGGSHK